MRDPFGVLNVTALSSSATTAMSTRYVIIVVKRRWSDTGAHLADNTVVRMTQRPEVHMETTRDSGPVLALVRSSLRLQVNQFYGQLSVEMCLLTHIHVLLTVQRLRRW